MRNVAPFLRRTVSLTPLIDVIFLLLLFFMLSSTFSKFAEIELGQATAGAAAPGTEIKRAFLQLGPDQLTLNGAQVALEALAAQLEDGQLLVSLAADTSSQRLVDLLVQLRGRAGLTVTVLE